VQERQLAIRRDEKEAVGLRHPACDLGEELRACDSDRDRQADAIAHLAPQTNGDLHRRACQPAQPADVEERLVDRQPFDQRGRVFEHPEQRLARVGVRGHPRRDDDGVRTEAAGLSSAHRRPDSPNLGFVARGEDDAAAHDHGPAAEPRVVALLHRRVEGVDVGVEDRRLVGHEHMFAYG
jgi:hypothetical protein